METAFISYARMDIAFVRRLHNALEERGRKAWVDWEGIPPVDKWLAKIRSAIDEADAFVFVISPDSVASEVCGVELDHAIKQHKRLIPLVYREVEASAVRHELSELNYIFARDADSFDTACDKLLTALDTDLEWVRAHTRLLVRTAEWDRGGRDASYTLRGRDLDYFEEWLAKSPDKEPKPTALQSEYLLSSRRTVTRRQRIIWGSVAVGLSIAAGLGTLAYSQNRERERQETIAEARQLVNRADALRDGPLDEPGVRGRLEDSTRSAARALATLHGLGVPTLDADQAVRKSYAALPKWIDVELERGQIDTSAFDATGTHLAVFRGRKHLMVWNTAHRQEIASCPQPLAAMESAEGVAVGRDGTLVATAIHNARADNTEITVWSMPDCSRGLQVRIPGRQERVALGDNGGYLVVGDNRWTIHLWEVASGAELSRTFADFVLAFALDPDGRHLATLERDRGERRYWIRIRELDSDVVVREWEYPGRGETDRWLQWRPNALLAGSDQTASIYDPGSGELVHHHRIEAGRFAVSPDGRFFAVPLKDENHVLLQIRDVATGSEVARTSHDAEVANLAFGPDNRSLVTVDREKHGIRMWFFERDGAFTELRDDAPIARMRFSENGSLLYTATEQGVSAWRLPLPGEDSTPRRQETRAVAAELFEWYRVEYPVASGSGGESATITVYAADAGLEPRTIAVDAPALAVSLSRDGERLAILLATGNTRGGDRRHLEIWNMEQKERTAMRGFEPVLDAAMASYLHFVGDDRYLVVGTRAGVEIVDAGQLTPVATLYHPSVTLTAMQGDGTLAATMGRNGVVRIWEMGSRNEIARIDSAQGAKAIELSNDDRWLATLEDVGTVRLWTLAPDDLIQQACRWLVEPCP